MARESGITGARAASVTYRKGAILEGWVGQAGTASTIKKDAARYQACAFVSFVQTLRRLLTSMEKIHARERQQSCCTQTQKKMGTQQ